MSRTVFRMHIPNENHALIFHYLFMDNMVPFFNTLISPSRPPNFSWMKIWDVGRSLQILACLAIIANNEIHDSLIDFHRQVLDLAVIYSPAKFPVPDILPLHMDEFSCPGRFLMVATNSVRTIFSCRSGFFLTAKCDFDRYVDCCTKIDWGLQVFNDPENIHGCRPNVEGHDQARDRNSHPIWGQDSAITKGLNHGLKTARIEISGEH